MTTARIAVHESRRELQRTRAEILRQRDLYMMALATVAVGNGGSLELTPEMIAGIDVAASVTVYATATGNIRVEVVNPPKRAEGEEDVVTLTPDELSAVSVPMQVDETAPALTDEQFAYLADQDTSEEARGYGAGI